MSRHSQSSVHFACDPDHWSAVARSCMRVLSLRLYTYFKITQLLDQEAVEAVILFDLVMSVILLEQKFFKHSPGKIKSSRGNCKLNHNS